MTRRQEEEVYTKQKQQALVEFLQSIDTALKPQFPNLSSVEQKKKQKTRDLHRRIIDWRRGVIETVAIARAHGAIWLQSEVGKDLEWYSNVLPVHSYELVVLIEKDTQSDSEKNAYHRTAVIVFESLRILSQALDELMKYRETRELLLLPHSELKHIEEVCHSVLQK